jgi:hypothetical protein
MAISAVRFAGQFVAWALLHSMSAAGRAMCCLPEGESPVARPRWWRAEARRGVGDINRYLERLARLSP